MTNSQLFIAVATPIVVILIGFIWQSKGIDGLRAEVNGKLDGVNARLDMLTRSQEVMQSDMKEFIRVTHDLDKRVSRLESA